MFQRGEQCTGIMGNGRIIIENVSNSINTQVVKVIIEKNALLFFTCGVNTS